MNRLTTLILRTVLPRIPFLLVLAGTRAFPWQATITSNAQEIFVRRSVDDQQEDSFTNGHITDNCSSQPEVFPQIFGEKQLGRGAILLHFFAVLYLSGCIGYICQVYFVPSLELLRTVWKIPEDVAGATIMAAGTSLPELFASIMGTFVTQDDTGVGAIVGSAAFNIYAILAICAFIAPKEGVRLSSFPILRDGFYWTVCMVVLVAVVIDGEIHWWESLILSLMYVAYCIVMVFNTSISETILGFIDTHLLFLNYSTPYANSDDDESIHLSESPTCSTIQQVDFKEENHNGSASHNDTATSCQNEKKSLSSKQLSPSQYGTSDAQAEYIEEALMEKTDDEDDDDDTDGGICSVFSFPDSWPMLTLWVLGLPLIAILCITVPDCRRPGISRKLYFITFIMAGVWMSCSCYMLFWMVTVIGTFFGIPSIVMGYTLLAIGTSLPDAVASGIVSQHGYYDMAVGNISGSNTFEIVVCLGMVWFLKSVSHNFEPVLLDTHGFSIVACVLLVSFIVSLLVFGLYGWRINRRVGVISLLIYIISLIAVTITENYANRDLCRHVPL